MAPTPIEIPIASETKAFKQGIEVGVIDPTEDAIKALDDLGKTKGPERLERELEQAQKATKNLSKEVERTADDIEDEFRRSYKSAENSAESFNRSASDATSEFKQEALSNFSEVTSSFNGSMSSIQDLAQGTLGGLASSLAGPVGIAAGGAAVAVGLVGGALENVQKEAEEAEQAAGEWAQAYIDAGSKIIGASQIAAEAQAIAADPERYKEAQENAKNWGVDYSTAVRAITGDVAALSVVEQRLNDDRAEANRLLAEQEVQVNKNAGAVYDLDDRVSRGESAFKKLTAAQAEGQRRFDQTSDTLKALAADAGEASKEVDELGNAVYTLPDETQIFIDAKTGDATTNVDKFKGDLDGIPEKVNTRVEFQVDDSALKRALESAQRNAKIRLQVTDQYGRNI